MHLKGKVDDWMLVRYVSGNVDNSCKYVLKCYHDRHTARKDKFVFKNFDLVSPYLVHTFDIVEDSQKNTYVLTEYAGSRDLFEMVGRFHELSPTFQAHLIHQMFEAVGAMHRSGWLHNDVKLENFFFDGENVRLGDLETATTMESPGEKTPLYGTRSYTHPRRRTSFPSQKDDLYALALSVNILLTGSKRVPTDLSTKRELFHFIWDTYLHKQKQNVEESDEKKIGPIVVKIGKILFLPPPQTSSSFSLKFVR
jgi:serine/threonine protein kinase